MAGGANNVFMRQGMKFLEKNFIFPYESNNALAENMIADAGKNNQDESNYGVFEFEMIKGSPNQIPAYRGNRKMDWYNVRIARANRKTSRRSNKLMAYYLPYKNNKTYTIPLGDEADYFFTPTLNGCTIAIGNGDNPKISHANSINPITQLIDRAGIDRDIGRLYSEGVSARLDKASYTNTFKKKRSITDYQAVVVGFRKNGRWEFYYQVAEKFIARDVLTGNMSLRYQVLVPCARLR